MKATRDACRCWSCAGKAVTKIACEGAKNPKMWKANSEAGFGCVCGAGNQTLEAGEQLGNATRIGSWMKDEQREDGGESSDTTVNPKLSHHISPECFCFVFFWYTVFSVPARFPCMREVVSSGLKVVPGGFEVVSSGVEVVSSGFEMASGGCEVVSSGFEVVFSGFEMVSNGFEVVSSGFVYFRALSENVGKRNF